MKIQNTIDTQVINTAAWAEESNRTGKTEANAKGLQEGVKAASYESFVKTTASRVQKGRSSENYTAVQNKEEQEKAVIEEPLEQPEKTEEALDRAASTLTEEDCEGLAEEGMTLEAYEAERLCRAIARMKANREFTEENLEGRLAKQEEYEAEIQKIALKHKIADTTARRLGQKLLEAGLPITEANLTAVLQALEMGSSAASLSDSGMAHMIGSQQAATIENLYHAAYAGGEAVPVEEELWEAVRTQVEGIVENSGFEVTEQRLQDGRWLLDHELPVTKTTLEELENLKGIRSQADEDYLFDRITEAMREGKLPKEANLDLETVRTRRRLEEIRLSMSEEAAKTLEEKGIRIDTEHMKEVIEELRSIEKEYYKALLSEAEKEAEPAKTALLAETLEKTEAIGKGPAYVLGKTLEIRHEQTLEGLYQETELMKQQAAARLEEAYEPLWTAPRRDMGDSIQKAFQNVDAILSELGLERTEENQRAVRILGYNQMALTEENIHQVKAYDASVNAVLEGLKPAVAVELIRRGENPLHRPIEELKQSINQIKEELGTTSEEKYSTYLWRLDKQSGGISEEERKSYIGLYRLLNNIEKTDGAAIGAVLHTQSELTLSNLLTAVRTLRSRGMDSKIDDSFGGLEEVRFSTERITDQIQQAFPERSEAEYLQTLVERTIEELSPEQVMKTVQEAGTELMNMSLESFCEDVRAREKEESLTQSYYREQVEMVRRLAGSSKEAAAFLEAYGGERTLGNLQAAAEWFTGNKNLFKEIAGKADNISKEKGSSCRESAQGLLEAMESFDSLQEAYQATTDTLQGITAEAFSNPELVSEEAEVLRLMQKGIALASRLSRQEHYELPIVIGEEVSSLSLTILKGTRENGKAEIRMDFPKQGVVEAELTVKEDEIKGFILCKTTEGQKLIEDCLGTITEDFEALGLTVKQLSVGTDARTLLNSQKELRAEGRPTKTRVLYQAAKAFVKQTIERTQVIENEN